MSPGPRRWRRATAGIETRKIARSAARSSPIWPGPGLAQVARIERRREIARKASTEIVYLITSQSPKTASPQRLLRLARDHWGIENRLQLRSATSPSPRIDAASAPAPAPWHRCATSPSPSSAGPACQSPKPRENFREDRANAITLVRAVG